MLVLPVSYDSHLFFFLMIRRPPRSTQSRSSAASDVYKRQFLYSAERVLADNAAAADFLRFYFEHVNDAISDVAVSYTHLRAHETVLDLVCRLLLEKKKGQTNELIAHAMIPPQQLVTYVMTQRLCPVLYEFHITSDKY